MGADATNVVCMGSSPVAETRSSGYSTVAVRCVANAEARVQLPLLAPHARLAEWPGAELQTLLRQFDSDAVLQFDGDVAQSGEPPVCTRQTRVDSCRLHQFDQRVAQLDERHPPKVKDAGSTPAALTMHRSMDRARVF